MGDWISDSDSDGSDNFEWGSDGEDEPLSASALSNLDVPGTSPLDVNGWAKGKTPSSSVVEKCVGMGYPKEMVLKAVKAIGYNDANALLELLLAFKTLGNCPSVDNCFTSGCTPHDTEDDDDDDLDFENWDDVDDGAGERKANSNGFSDESERLSASALSNLDAPVPSTLDFNGCAKGKTPPSSVVEKCVGMGYPKEMVLKAVKAVGYNDANALLELLLTFKALGNYPTVDNCFTSGCTPHGAEDDNDGDLDSENWDDDDDYAGERETSSNGSSDEDILQVMLEKDKRINSLVGVGFPEDMTNIAITRCGVRDSLFALLDSKKLSAPEVTNKIFNSLKRSKEGRFMEENKKKRKQCGGGAQGNRLHLDGSDDKPMPLPNPMVGFNLPTDKMVRPVKRKLPKQAIGPPFFYYENVAQAPKGVWTTISRTLYGVEPEFVDSKYLCAAARKRGYIHNLPIENREKLLPVPPKTIFEAFPRYRKWWPSWDSRKQLNCLSTCVPSAKLTERISCGLSKAGDPPSRNVQKYVMDECKRYNLVWVGKNKVAPLEAHEMEYLLGFPRDHTRGLGITERYKSLGNSFQIDTVGYHLSVLRDMFPNGIKVLSLFSGIGGGEVALHRLGIRMTVLVSVEISKVNRRVLTNWWEQNQTGTLIDIQDVETLTNDKIESFTKRFGGFDLVIGGSPCNNLAGRNRFHRDGLEGKHSALFYHYARILDTVKSVMARL